MQFRFLVGVGVAAGISTVLAGWAHGPVLAVVCAPMISSLATILCATLLAIRRAGRRSDVSLFIADRANR